MTASSAKNLIPATAAAPPTTLTPDARALEPELAAAGHAVIAQATQGIPAATLAAFDQTLADMASNLTAGLNRAAGSATRSERDGER